MHQKGVKSFPGIRLLSTSAKTISQERFWARSLQKTCAKGKKVDIIEVFDDGVPKSPTMANDICARLNGKLNLIPTTEKELVRVINEFEQYLEKVNQTVLIQGFITLKKDSF